MALLSINLITVLESPRVLAISNILFCAPWKKWKRRVCYLLNLIILYSKLGIEHKKQPPISCLVSQLFTNQLQWQWVCRWKERLATEMGRVHPIVSPRIDMWACLSIPVCVWPYKSSLHVLHTHFGHLIVKLKCTNKKINAHRVNILLKWRVDLVNLSKYWSHCSVNHWFLGQHFEETCYAVEHGLS